MLALAGCAAAERPSAAGPSPEARAQLDALEAPFRAPGTVVARLGGTARLGNASVRPLAIIEDSRCPVGVACVWAGRVRVRVAISGVPGEPEMQIGAPVALPGGGAIVLTAVAPHPWHDPPPGVDRSAPARFAFLRRDD